MAGADLHGGAPPTLGGTSRSASAHAINVVTTATTNFFREPHYVEYLRTVWFDQQRTSASRQLRFRLARCSAGEEPCTLAITLTEMFGSAARTWNVEIIAMDISTVGLTGAAAGDHPLDRVTADVPASLRHKYFLQHPRWPDVVVHQELRRWVPSSASL